LGETQESSIEDPEGKGVLGNNEWVRRRPELLKYSAKTTIQSSGRKSEVSREDWFQRGGEGEGV